MIRLLTIEIRKLIPYKAFWILVILHFGLLALVLSQLQNFIASIEFSQNGQVKAGGLHLPVLHFPDIWLNISFIASFFSIILAVLVMLSLTNEFSFRTSRQNVIDGLSRLDFILSKTLFMVCLSIFSALFLLIVGLILGYANSTTEETTHFSQNMEFIPAYFFELLGYLLLAFLFSMLIRKSGLAIILFLTYNVVIENIIAYILGGENARWLPGKVINSLISNPFGKYIGMPITESLPTENILLVILYCLIFWALSYLHFNKRDL
jgi:ABC-2 type transport system permease protein